ncbi:MAG: UDP-N-acetylglucosamine 2-epimerase (non-hydrolyzing) [Pseudomonadota bacterium]
MKNKILIHLIAAARPNFMKIAPLYHALKKKTWADPKIVHTGQHYDLNMSDVFFQDLGLPEPDLHLGIGSGSHAEQTGQVLIAYEKVLRETKPDLVVVVGDVNSTMACTLAATKISYNSTSPSAVSPHSSRRPLVAHLEAGLRSFDRSMPEEVNRLVTDALADILWTPSADGDAHLTREGVSPEKIIRVGNIMIDSLEMLRKRIEATAVYKELDLQPKKYGLITLHRPSNVDHRENLETLSRLLARISDKLPLVFPVHPRTRKNLETHGILPLLEDKPGIRLLTPQSYVRFMSLVFNSRLVVTDSGGIQEETSYLNIPCFTMRLNTERPVTVTNGTNRLCTIENLETHVDHLLSGNFQSGSAIEFWDGKTASRVIESIENYFEIKPY